MWWKTLIVVGGFMCLTLVACHNIGVDHKIDANINHNVGGTINHKIDLPQNIEIRGPLGGKLGNIKINPNQPQNDDK